MQITVEVNHKSGNGFDASFSSYRELIQWATEQEQKRVEWVKQQTGGGVPEVVKREEKVKTILRKKK